MKKILSIAMVVVLLNFSLPCLADGVEVSLSQVALSSKLKKDYNGYKYVILNNSNQNLTIVNAQILNAVNGNVAYQSVNNGHPIGTTWAICGPVGLFTLGIGWAAGLVATPIVWGISSSNNKKAQKEAVSYPNIINTTQLSSGESISTNVLVPIGTQPQLKMTFQTNKSKELFTMSK